MDVRKKLLLFYFVKLDYINSRKRTHPDVDATFAMLLPMIFELIGDVPRFKKAGNPTAL